MFLFIRRTISPPYWGLPSASHQFPTAVVVDIVVGETVVLVVVGCVVEVVVVDVAVGFVVVVVVDFAHDAKINDIAMRQVNTIQIAPLFMLNSFICNGLIHGNLFYLVF